MNKILLFFLFISNFSIAQIVQIPDSSFKSYLISNTTININGDNEIQINEASSYTDTLDIYNMAIINLTGIEAFTSIKYLDCSSNSLEKLDLSANKELEYINCSYNSISELDVKSLVKIEYMDCSHNQIEVLSTESNTMLKTLDCSSNSISELGMLKNDSLQSLNCLNNSITKLRISPDVELTMEKTTEPIGQYHFSKKNSIQLDLLGQGIFTISYERRIINKDRFKTVGKIGTMYIAQGVNWTISSNQIFSFKMNHIELGTGITIFHEPDFWNWKPHITYSPLIFGYRYQKPNGWFIFKAGYYSHLWKVPGVLELPDDVRGKLGKTHIYRHFGGISLGATF